MQTVDATENNVQKPPTKQKHLRVAQIMKSLSKIAAEMTKTSSQTVDKME